MSNAMFYFPRFHQEFMTAEPPAPLAFIASALVAQPGSRAKIAGGDAVSLFASSLPLGSREAKMLLDEMFATATQMGGLLRPFFFQNRDERSRREEREADSAAAENFRKNGGTDAFPVGGTTLPAAAEKEYEITCQKLLLLIKAMEENVLERRDVLKQCSAVERKLRQNFAEGSGARENGNDETDVGEDGVFPFAAKCTGVQELETTRTELPDWKTALCALLPFLPEAVPLYTDEQDVIDALLPFAAEGCSDKLAAATLTGAELLTGRAPSPIGRYAEKKISFVFPCQSTGKKGCCERVSTTCERP